MSEKWNDGQLQAIENTDGNMIVSASAGSGKTAVMIERVKRLILDKKIPVSRILMLSFNEAIAEEIKEKMAKALIEEIKSSDDKDFLREQIDALGTADITTMHSFCNSLIKEYFDVVGVDPSYTIMDDKESNVIINKSINEVFDEAFESGDSDFLLLKDKLSDNGDDALRNAVTEIFKFSNSLLNGEEWLSNAAFANYNRPLDKTKPVKYLVDELIGKVNDTYDAVETAYNVLDTTKFTDIEAMLNHLIKYQNEEDIKKYYSFIATNVDCPKIRMKSGDPDKEFYSNAKDAYRDLLTTIKKLYPVPYEKMEQDHREDKIVVDKLVEIVSRFKTYYNREKAEVNKLDFNDMEHYAVEILSHDDIAKEVKNKYDYVCVDEYQDTNEVQNRVLYSVSKGDNLFQVGDPKQSIYKFRFTEPEIFIRKLQDYRDNASGEVVELTKNYRSSPLILKRINNVFDYLMTNKSAGMIREAYSRLNNGQEFEDKIDDPFEVMLYEVPSKQKQVIDEPNVYRVSEHRASSKVRLDAEIEAEYIASKVEKLLTEEIYDIKTSEYRPIKFDDMAILAQNRTPVVKMILEILEQDYNLPIDATYLKKKDEPQEVKILLDFLRTIDNPRQDIPLYTVMKMFFDFTDSDFVEMKRLAGKTKNYYTIVFDDIIKDERLRAKLDDFKATLDDYRMMSTFMNVHDFLLSAIEKSDFKRKLLMSANGKVAIDNIDKFLITLKDKKHASTVQEFLYAYDNYNVINDIDATSQSVKNSIHTSTIHQSKGLEYPIVFIVNAGTPFISTHMSRSEYLLDKDFGFAIRTYNEHNKTVYSNWLIEGIKNKREQEEKEEKLRLLYVAMTRAKNCLYIVGKVSASDKKSVETTKKFTDWLYYIADNNDEFAKCMVYKSKDDVDNVVVKSVKDKVRAFDYQDYSEADAKHYAEVFDYKYPYEEATHIAQKYTVTSINHEEREKEEYVPELYETEKTSIGSIYHKFMEHVNYDMDTIEGIKAEMARMIDEKILTEEECQNICIDDVYKCLNSAIIKKAKVNKHEREKKFMMHLPLSAVKDGASDEKVIIQGIADLVIYGDENILVDFKHSTQSEYMLRQSYQKQLDLYKFALEESMGIKFDGMYLYVIGQDKIIDMTK